MSAIVRRLWDSQSKVAFQIPCSIRCCLQILMLKVLSEAGNYVKDEVWHALIVVISNASNLYGYAVRSLYRLVQTSGDQETLVRVAVWCIGEYGDMLLNNVVQNFRCAIPDDILITGPVFDTLATFMP